MRQIIEIGIDKVTDLNSTFFEAVSSQSEGQPIISFMIANTTLAVIK